MKCANTKKKILASVQSETITKVKIALIFAALSLTD